MFFDVHRRLLSYCLQPEALQAAHFLFSQRPAAGGIFQLWEKSNCPTFRPAAQLGNKEIEKQMLNEKHIQIKHVKKKHENHACGNKTKINIEK